MNLAIEILFGAFVVACVVVWGYCVVQHGYKLSRWVILKAITGRERLFEVLSAALILVVLINIGIQARKAKTEKVPIVIPQAKVEPESRTTNGWVFQTNYAAGYNGRYIMVYCISNDVAKNVSFSYSVKN